MNDLAPLQHIIQRVVQAQKREAGKLKAILDSIADGVIVQDEAGNIEMMNPSARHILDALSGNLPVPREQTLDSEAYQARVKAKESSLLSYLAGLEFYEPQNIEIERRVLNALSAPVVMPAGERAGAVFVLRDVTSEVEAIKLKDNFITSISHELRTPLAVIKGHNDLLRMSLSAVVSDQQENFRINLENVDNNITDLLNLIEHMLDLTQIEAGVFWVNRERIDVLALLRAEAEQWQEMMADNELAYHLDLPKGPIWIYGDENRLTRVLHYLLDNAHNYTLPGGRVAVKLRQGSDHIQVDVTDTGVGIDPKYHPFIFERFFRAIHAGDTYEVSGSGLGLFMSKTIIEAHDGKIWFESEIDKGSTFSFSLPTIADTGINL